MNKKHIIKMIAFPLIAGLVVFLISHFFFVPTSSNLSGYAMFYKEENQSLDVVLIGNSTVKSGFVPAHAWQNYGFTSFVIADAPTHPEVIKIALQEIARLQKPKVVYVDINGITYQKKSDAKSFVKRYIDSMPDSKHKTELQKQYNFETDDNSDDKIFKNHNQFRNPDFYRLATWKYSKADFSSIMKGYQAVAYSHIIEHTLMPDDRVLPIFDDGKEYLYEILEICKRHADIDFIFGKMPRYLTKANIDATYQLRSAQPIIESYGYKFMDFYNHLDQIGLDKTTDQYDDEHMNHNGAIKFTNFFSKYLVDTYDFDANHPESVKNSFDLSYEKYCVAIKKAELNLQKSHHKQTSVRVGEASAFTQTYSFNKLIIIIPALILVCIIVLTIISSILRRKKIKTESITT